VGKVFIAWLSPGASIRATTAVTTPFNPEGDWGNAYQLADQGASVELVCDFHAKRRRVLPPGDIRYDYLVTIRNAGPVVAPVFVDW
jgi:hypothetical protein